MGKKTIVVLLVSLALASEQLHASSNGLKEDLSLSLFG
jgi:hypothetical protein